MRRVIAIASVSLCTASLFAVAGCSAKTGATPGAEPPPGTAATPGSGGASAARATQAPSPAATVQGRVPDLGAPIASRTVKANGDTYDLDLYPVLRQDAVTTVNVRVRYTTVSGDEAAIDVLSSQSALSATRGLPDGIRIVDPKNKKVYLPALGSGNDALCSPDLPMHAKSGDEAYVTCLFGSPPADITTVNVNAARFGDFSDVPIR